MGWARAFELVGAIIVSIGGASAIVFSLSKYLANMMAERLEMKYQLKLDKELEGYKANLDKRTYITKTQFDIEVDIYRKLSKGIYEFIVTLNSTVSKHYYKYEGLQLEKELEKEKGRFMRMTDQGGNIQKLLFSNAAFMPKHIYEQYNELVEMATDQFWIYFERFFKYYEGEITSNERVTENEREKLKVIKEKYERLNDSLRDYLQQIQIVD